MEKRVNLFLSDIYMCLDIFADQIPLRYRLVALKAKIKEQKKHLEELDNLVYLFNPNIALSTTNEITFRDGQLGSEDKK